MNRVAVIALLIFSSSVFADPPQYIIQDLDELAGHKVFVQGMNDRGQLTGYYNDQLPDGSVRGRSFLYSNGKFENFSTLVGDGKEYRSRGSINNLGEIVLYDDTDDTGYWLYSEDGLAPLAIDRSFSINAMNDVGAMVGVARIGSSKAQAFVYKDGLMQFFLPSPLYEFQATGATDINNAGVIVGFANDDIECCYREGVFIYENGQVSNVFSNYDPIEIVLNGLGHYAVTSRDYEPGWCDSGFFTNFGYSFSSSRLPYPSYEPFPIDEGSADDGSVSVLCPSVNAINDHDAMVGLVTRGWEDFDGQEHERDYGMLYEAGQVFWLINYLKGPHDYVRIRPTDINNQGWIVATAEKADGSIVQVLLQPEGTVSMDVQPWDSRNRVASASNDFIAVAVKGSSIAAGNPADFDASQIDPSSLRLGNGGALTTVGPWLFDWDGDGAVDAFYGFQAEDTATFCEDTSMTLVGETFAGEPFVANDFIQTTGCDGLSCHPQ